MNARSPIERMIDEATGYSGSVKVERPRIECPVCGQSKATSLDDSDPVGTCVIRYGCDKCRKEGELPKYFDRDNQELTPPWEDAEDD